MGEWQGGWLQVRRLLFATNPQQKCPASPLPLLQPTHNKSVLKCKPPSFVAANPQRKQPMIKPAPPCEQPKVEASLCKSPLPDVSFLLVKHERVAPSCRQLLVKEHAWGCQVLYICPPIAASCIVLDSPHTCTCTQTVLTCAGCRHMSSTSICTAPGI